MIHIRHAITGKEWITITGFILAIGILMSIWVAGLITVLGWFFPNIHQ